jgi:hypothetical protein
MLKKMIIIEREHQKYTSRAGDDDNKENFKIF